MAIEIVDQVNGWLKTAMSAIFHPTAKPGNNLQQIIMSETRDFGPSVLTGGQLHKINSATATLVANEIIATAPVVQQVLKGSVTQAIAFLAAGICGESRFDPCAINPNLNKYFRGESIQEAFWRHDLGIAQFSARVLCSDPSMKGLTNSEIQLKAEDIKFAIPHFAALVAKLITDTKAETDADPGILKNVPINAYLILATEAYNTGFTGAKNLTALAKGNWTYGSNWLSKTADYIKILQG